jgi:hypothetical protein
MELQGKKLNSMIWGGETTNCSQEKFGCEEREKKKQEVKKELWTIH